MTAYALFKDGKQVCKAHTTQHAAVIDDETNPEGWV